MPHDYRKNPIISVDIGVPEHDAMVMEILWQIPSVSERNLQVL
jgi:hypothetical protein